MRRLALIAAAVALLFSAFAVTNTAEAGGHGRPGFRGNHAPLPAMRLAQIKRNKQAAAALAAGLLGVAAITEAIASNFGAHGIQPTYAGLRPGGVVVAHNPDFPMIEGYANPCSFERVMDFYGRPTSRVVKVCR